MASNSLPPESELWRRLLLGTDPSVVRLRRRHRHIPSPPRCKMCAAPFGPPGGWVLRYLGHARWAKNPKYCEGCFRTLQANHGGAEVECSLLFADVRGSTTLAEGMRPTDFRALMGRFYDEAFEALIDFNAIVDKFVGDEVIGIFIPAYSGQEHVRHALDAALRLLQVTGHGLDGGPWIPIGVGVQSGVAFVGSVGQGVDTELTALGDPVNVAARLAAGAGPGEILITTEAAAAAGDDAGREHRSLSLKGKSEPTEVVVVTADHPTRDRQVSHRQRADAAARSASLGDRRGSSGRRVQQCRFRHGLPRPKRTLVRFGSVETAWTSPPAAVETQPTRCG